jgi:hypothetical protein
VGGFDKLIRSGVATAHKLLGGFGGLEVEVEFEQWIGSDANGQPLYAGPKTLEAVVELATQPPRLSLATNKQVTPRARVTLLSMPSANGAEGRTEPIDSRDRFTLPDGQVGNVLAISGVFDPVTNAQYSVEMWIG